MKAISIRQPWAWLIVNGYKDIENRTWTTKMRGPVMVHASKGMTRREYNDVAGCIELLSGGESVPLPPYENLERGGIVGVVEITGVVTESKSPWFFGPKGFTLSNAAPVPLWPCKGALGFFTVPGLGELPWSKP